MRLSPELSQRCALAVAHGSQSSSAEDALENINQVSEGIVHETLKNFLETNLPKVDSLFAKTNTVFFSSSSSTSSSSTSSSSFVHFLVLTCVQTKPGKGAKFQLGVADAK